MILPSRVYILGMSASVNSSLSRELDARPRRRAVGRCVVIALAALTIGLLARGRGYKTWALRRVDPAYGHRPLSAPAPSVVRTRPADRDANVLPADAFVAADVDLPFSGAVVDANSLNADSVRLYLARSGKPVPAVVNTSGAGDAIVLRPMQALDLGAQYTFEVTSFAKDTAGHPFRPYKASFWTAASERLGDFPAAFTKVPQPTATGHMFTCVTIGPDHRLYASTLSGHVFRYDIGAGGMLGQPEAIETVNRDAGRARLITGLTFDPAATADRLILWVSHGQLPTEAEKGQAWIKGAADWTGAITRLSGANLEKGQDVIVGLPRGWKDHLNNQMVFGPDGGLYFCQAANTAMGAPDAKWGFRPERLLTAAILRLDVRAIDSIPLPLNVKTEEGGDYDPYAPGAPLTLYATGVRNSFDLLWHSNGSLYAGINGSAAGGNAPATPATGAERIHRLDSELRGPYAGPAIPSLSNIPETEDDMLFKIEQGGYYGHPNPARAEYVLNGGNPSPGPSPYPVHAYPPGVLPDRNWRPAIYSFGKNLSPCGVIEYQSPLFGNALKGKVLYVRYSGGDDILALSLDDHGNVAESLTGVDGFTHFVNPVDLIEDPASGSLYVAEFGGQRITLVKPASPQGTGQAAASHHVCRAAVGAARTSLHGG